MVYYRHDAHCLKVFGTKLTSQSDVEPFLILFFRQRIPKKFINRTSIWQLKLLKCGQKNAKNSLLNSSKWIQKSMPETSKATTKIQCFSW